MTNTLLKTNLNTKERSQPEIELLLACSRTRVSPELAARIKELVQQDLDWQRLFDLGSRHQLIPLIYHNLSRICRDAVPAESLALMQNIFAYKARTNLFITSELIRICRLFAQNDIFAIPFKGMTLAMTAYRNLTFRDSCDIDILISKQDFPLATKLLEDSGYETIGYINQVKDNPDLRYGSFLQSEANQKGYDFYNPTKKIAIDLQWSVTVEVQSRYFAVDFEQFKQNATEVELAGNKLPQFAPEMMVLYLCFHGSKHCWQSLKWVCDLAEFITSHPDLDWQAIEQQAIQLKLKTMLHLGLLLAHNFYQIDIPQSLLRSIQQNTRAKGLYNQVRQLIFTRCFTQWEDYAFIFQISDSWRGKLQFLKGLFFTPTAKEWNTVQLPKPLFFLYYFIRPYRLTKEYLTVKNKTSTADS
ncbi:MAG: nucleotidyltransferase family protein [Cyanobacteria bacterium J06643_13]